MKVVTNKTTIKRNGRIGQYTTIAALLILVGGIYISFAMPEQFGLSLGALLMGFFLSQAGIYFGNRWSRRPRVDEIITAGLKGIPGEYTLYHFSSPTSHLLVGPAGVWTLLPYYQRGTITYRKGRWQQSGGGLLLAYLKIFAQEGLGRPDLEARSEVERLEKFLKDKLEGAEPPAVRAALVFTDERADIQVDDAPLPTLPIKKLKDYLRSEAKDSPLSADQIKRITALLPKEDL